MPPERVWLQQPPSWAAVGLLVGVALYFFGTAIWLFVLARGEVSYAYPFVGLSFIITLLLDRLLMGDVLTVKRVIVTALVSTGVLLIAK